MLIMSPWNYPFMLALEPAVDAIAAGNTVVIKPGSYSSATSQVLEDLITTYLPPQLAAVIQGGRDVNQDLLDQKFDYIFFTGGKTVGRLVMEKAAAHLTPITLELGGKSPCIVDASANLKVAASRIAFGKYLNCGQTCVAPDYLLIQESVKDRFLELFKKAVVQQYGAQPLDNQAYGKIINEKHFKRIVNLYKDEPLIWGGETREDRLRIAPTVVDGITWDSPLMGEEIFGPVLPGAHLQGHQRGARPGGPSAHAPGPVSVHHQPGQQEVHPRPGELRRRLHQRHHHPSGHLPHGLRRRG